MATGETEFRIWSVSDLTQEIRDALYQQPSLRSVWVSGEVSNLNRAASGHTYFTLKDSQSALRCVLFQGHGRKLPFDLQSGMDVIAQGHIDVYEKSGQYQLYVRSVEPAGLGSLHLSLQLLKRRLSDEGLFSDEIKRPLPRFPQCVGVVTSRSGAAIRDIVHVLRRRNPTVDIVLSHASVQGEAAPAELCLALQRLQQEGSVDVIILGRGGGSVEDLWAFNDESLVRAVAACSIPIVSAVGHETDDALTDWAADVRAPTPSAAAEIVVPDRERLVEDVQALGQTMARRLTQQLRWYRLQFDSLLNRRSLRRPQDLLQRRTQRLDELSASVRRSQDRRLERLQSLLLQRQAQIGALSPWAILSRGYGLITDEQGEIRTTAQSFSVGELLQAHFSDGVVTAEVRTVKGGRGDDDHEYRHSIRRE